MHVSDHDLYKNLGFYKNPDKVDKVLQESIQGLTMFYKNRYKVLQESVQGLIRLYKNRYKDDKVLHESIQG